MSYKNFQVVKQIVLPFVASIDMTYSEYQEEYGIDLATLDLYDKIFVKGEDKVAVPVLAVDKINKVLYTADKAFSYDDEFRELSGDSIIKEIVEGGSVDNIKPIYCHPLEIFKANVGILTALVFDNSIDPIDTWDKLKTKINNFLSGSGVRRLVTSGSWKVDTDTIICGEIATNAAGDSFFAVGFDTAGVYHGISGAGAVNLTSETGISVVDGVNKIN